jgi:hypothetical protein
MVFLVNDTAQIEKELRQNILVVKIQLGLGAGAVSADSDAASSTQSSK